MMPLKVSVMPLAMVTAGLTKLAAAVITAPPRASAR